MFLISVLLKEETDFDMTFQNELSLAVYGFNDVVCMQFFLQVPFVPVKYIFTRIYVQKPEFPN